MIVAQQPIIALQYNETYVYNNTLTQEQLNQLSPQELEVYFHEQNARHLRAHAGHEKTHSQMALILLVALVLFQFVLLIWKKKHPKNFHLVSCMGLWSIPFLMSVKMHNWRFVTVWVIYSAVNSCVIARASKKPLDHLTPAIVYKWYSAMYHLWYGVGSAGYVVFIMTLFGVVNIFYSGPEPVQFGLYLLFYGLYFGVLSRDFVEMCSERMTSTMGYYLVDGFARKQLGANVCAVCGANVDVTLAMTPKDSAAAENEAEAFRLPCSHIFHRSCIKGWCLIGKKDVCPYCKERFDRKDFAKNPWETQQQHYLTLLDGAQYLLVWQPVVFAAVRIIFYITGMD